MANKATPASTDEVSVGEISIGLFVNKEALLERLCGAVESGSPCVAIAVNPEKVMASMSQPELKQVLLRCDVRYADGIGVVRAMRSKSVAPVSQIPGCELWEALMQKAGENQYSVFLVGAHPDVLLQTENQLCADYGTTVVGSQDGYFTNEDAVIQRIKDSGARIVTVAMGSPKQEHFIFKCRDAGIDAVFMGVGGTYDVYTGNVKRAPRVWRQMGLEWLYRLLSQPKRIGRQVNLVRFAFLMLTKRL